MRRCEVPVSGILGTHVPQHSIGISTCTALYIDGSIIKRQDIDTIGLGKKPLENGSPSDIVMMMVI